MKLFDINEVPAGFVSDAIAWNDEWSDHTYHGHWLRTRNWIELVIDSGSLRYDEYEEVRLWFAQRKGLIREAIPIQCAVDEWRAKREAKEEEAFQRKYDAEQDMAAKVRLAYQKAEDDRRNNAMMNALGRAFECAS